MHVLHIGPDWAMQVAAIRHAHTEDSNLIRWGNNFYRLCRDKTERFRIDLRSGDHRSSVPLMLEIDSRDFYVSNINGVPMERYSSLLRDCTASFGNLNHAVHSLAGRRDPASQFEHMSMLVFCVAESIRNDQLATTLGQTFAAASMRIGGVRKELRLLPWWDLVHLWGQTCDAIYALLSADANKVARLQRTQLNAAQRRLSEYVDCSRLPPKLQDSARMTAVLKRPKDAK